MTCDHGLMSLLIEILCPAKAQSRSGNRATALRWAGLIKSLGHRVKITDDLRDPNFGEKADVAILLHAYKCRAAAKAFRARHPDRPLVVALTGTDLYHDLNLKPATQRSLELADRVILLQRAGLSRLAPAIRRKARVIHQSTPVIETPAFARERGFEVCVVGHLRAVKDPMRCAMAVRSLPPDSLIRVSHLGGAMTDYYRRTATHEDQVNPRYQWLGELSPHATRKRIAKSHLLVLSSKMEGGANVIGEACVAGVPILASNIEGNVGLLGKRHPGFFETGDTQQLRTLLLRCENDYRFYQRLQQASLRHAPDFSPERERECWHKLFKELQTNQG